VRAPHSPKDGGSKRVAGDVKNLGGVAIISVFVVMAGDDTGECLPVGGKVAVAESFADLGKEAPDPPCNLAKP